MVEAFERASHAVVDGDVATLERLLASEPTLASARSNDAFEATLLHFVAANGVPDALQRSPANAPDVARALLAAGADPDATCRGYGGGENETTLCLLVSSWPPFERGVQSALVRVLVEGGAAADGRKGDGAPLTTALVFGYTSAAEALVRAGARPQGLFHHAGLGELADVDRCVPSPGEVAPGALGRYAPVIAKEIDAEDPAALAQEALHFAVTHGRRDVAELLLSRGADVNGRTTGHHCELPLLQAAFVHEADTALWLLERGADPDLVDGKRGESARDHVLRAGPDALRARLGGA